jgi:Xaa-Pro aminopeptidase
VAATWLRAPPRRTPRQCYRPKMLTDTSAARYYGVPEPVRATRLRSAQATAIELFDQVIGLGLIRPGVRETALSNEIRELAHSLYGTKRHWHKRIVRSGPNTIYPYRENPPDRVIEDDDIVFLDFGPVFDNWEADLGRTYVLGSDPLKERLRADLEPIWEAGKLFFDQNEDVTGAQLYSYVCSRVRDAGWDMTAPHAGHLIGEFPHEKIADDKKECYIAPSNHRPLRRLDPRGSVCHWILEVHLLEEQRRFGGFFEQLLTLA